jgi:hypothetical protein
MTNQRTVSLNKNYSEAIINIALQNGESFSTILNSIIHSTIDDFIKNHKDEITDYKRMELASKLEDII